MYQTPVPLPPAHLVSPMAQDNVCIPLKHDLAPSSLSLEQVSKRARPASYLPPKTIPQSVISTVGSYAVIPNARTVPLRRQLSSSKIEEFLGGDSSMMDVDAPPTIRRMSF